MALCHSSVIELIEPTALASACMDTSRQGSASIDWRTDAIDMQRQLTVTKTQLRDLRLSNESNQAKLLDHTKKQGMVPCSRHKTTVIDCSLNEEVVAKLAEVDMTIADLDRANSRIVALEHHNVSNVLHPVPCFDCVSGNPASRN